MRDNGAIFMLPRSTRPTRDGSNAARPETPGFWRKLCRYAVSSSVSGLTDRLRHAPYVAQAFAASMRLILSLLSPQHNFLRRITTKSALISAFVYKQQPLVELALKTPLHHIDEQALLHQYISQVVGAI
ncbi:hypothetical protein PEC301619_25860 [Pectobacterium carotovorum subsp. carotovorum]|nr:hypothetical protein PEC301619_25860 [Pectobacterium carotovorum subsp. carotovorum]